MNSKHTPTKNYRWFRRFIRAFLIVCGVAVLALGVWLLDHLRPRHAHFLNRSGPIAQVEILDEGITPDGLHQTLVELQANNGLTVRFRVMRPGDSSEPLPLVVLLAGHRTGSQAVELIGDPGPLAVAALDYPYQGPEKIRSVWSGVTNLAGIQRALLDTPPAVSVTLNWLVEQPWVDAERIELIGASLGVPFATVAGALDKRFQRVWLLHGGADNREWLASSLRRKVEHPTARELVSSLLHLLAHGASFDTAGWVARIAPRPVVVIGASDDESLTRETVRKLHAAAGEPKELLWTTGGHVTSKRTEVIRDLLGLVRERI